MKALSVFFVSCIALSFASTSFALSQAPPVFDQEFSNSNGYLIEINHDKAQDGSAVIPPRAKQVLLEGLDQVVGPKRHRSQDFANVPMLHVRALTAAQFNFLVKHPSVGRIFQNEDVVPYSFNTDVINEPPIAGVPGFDANGTTIAVIDSGIDISRSDFGTCPTVGAPGCRVTDLVEIAPNDGSNDDTGHGTNVAGIAAAVATGAKFVGLDVFALGSDGGQHAQQNDVISALTWVWNNWQARNIVAANLSLGGGSNSSSVNCGTFSGPFSAIYGNLHSVGIVIAVAAGNGHVTALSDEACDANATVVGAMYGQSFTGIIDNGSCTDANPGVFTVACFSNSHPWVAVAAPGVDVTAAGSTYSGTSQATPHVAAAAAIIAPVVDGTSTLPSRLNKTRAALGSSRTTVTDWASESYPALNLVDAIVWGSDSTYSAVSNIVSPYYFVSSTHHVGDRQLMDLMSYWRTTHDTGRVRARALAPLIEAAAF